MPSVHDLLELVRYGTTGVIIGILVVIAAVLRANGAKPSDKQFLMLLLFFGAVLVTSVVTGYLDRSSGPWIFVATIQNVTKPIHADKTTLYEITEKDDQNLSTQHIFYISHSQKREGDTLRLPVLDPQPGRASHTAWACFTKEPDSYTEEQVSLDSGGVTGDVSLTPNGSGNPRRCLPDGTKTAQAVDYVSIMTPAYAAQETPAKYTYTPSGQHAASGTGQAGHKDTRSAEDDNSSDRNRGWRSLPSGGENSCRRFFAQMCCGSLSVGQYARYQRRVAGFIVNVAGCGRPRVPATKEQIFK